MPQQEHPILQKLERAKASQSMFDLLGGSSIGPFVESASDATPLPKCDDSAKPEVAPPGICVEDSTYHAHTHLDVSDLFDCNGCIDCGKVSMARAMAWKKITQLVGCLDDPTRINGLSFDRKGSLKALQEFILWTNEVCPDRILNPQPDAVSISVSAASCRPPC